MNRTEPREFNAPLWRRLQARLLGTRVVELQGPALFVFYRYRNTLYYWSVTV